MRPGHSLRLDGAEVGVVWPAREPAGVLVLLGDGAARTLADDLGVVVLCARADDAEATVAWAADHASQLGASGPLYVAGEGAAALADRARDAGWPQVRLMPVS